MKRYGYYILLSIILSICCIINSVPLHRKTTLFPSLRFHQTIATLNKIRDIIEKKQKGVYLRFGDGDVNLAEGIYDMYQSPRADLAYEMREAFALNGPTILKTLPLYCAELGGLEEGMFRGNCETDLPWCTQIINRAQQFWHAPISDVYSHAALRFATVQYPDVCRDFLIFLKKNNCYLLVGNKNILPSIRINLFGPQCKFVPTPDRNSYSEMDRIEQECLNAIALDRHNNYKIIIVAMGCSSRVLEKRLWKKVDNIFLFDFGSLMDALCGWPTRDWIEAPKNQPAIQCLINALETL